MLKSRVKLRTCISLLWTAIALTKMIMFQIVAPLCEKHWHGGSQTKGMLQKHNILKF